MRANQIARMASDFKVDVIKKITGEMYNIKRRFDHKLRTRARDLAINFRVLREKNEFHVTICD